MRLIFFISQLEAANWMLLESSDKDNIIPETCHRNTKKAKKSTALSTS